MRMHVLPHGFTGCGPRCPELRRLVLLVLEAHGAHCRALKPVEGRQRSLDTCRVGPAHLRRVLLRAAATALGRFLLDRKAGQIVDEEAAQWLRRAGEQSECQPTGHTCILGSIRLSSPAPTPPPPRGRGVHKHTAVSHPA
jgi:hypothetical protein